ncbi:hypothetical protein BDV25DRAFT_149886 [Aspergillus avenaceus]|uniref:F-box domain-containing protein n=1 Tax=Aspergillus avenaceus TaxID=36643 RepID=A0A5N6U3L7_ASPAV|nr:hypothetical protein BDV25DRAFT_149886 [Aspergillus avenaceus]
MGYLGFHCGEAHPPEPPNAYIHCDRQESDQPSWYSLKLQPLLSLCLVSKRLLNIVQPILYHDFMPGYGDSWRSDIYAWDRRLTSFMRTVAHRRDLAALVKRIYIHPYLIQKFSGEKGIMEYDPMWHRDIFKVVRAEERKSIGEDEAQDTLRDVAHALGIQELQQLSVHDLVTVLIRELPNLDRCSFQIGPYHEEIVRRAGLCATGISGLSIRTIDISLRATSLSATHGNLFDLGRCANTLLNASTSLKTLNLHMCKGISRRTPFPSLPNLESLRLTYSRLSERELEGLLGSCNSLRRFHYEATYCPFTGYNSSYDCSDHFQLSNAVGYLARHRATLESLHFDLRCRGHSQDGPDHRAVFSFKEFTSLKHIFLNLDEFHTRFWAGHPAEDPELFVRLIPHSIESVHLAGRITDQLPRLEGSLLGLAEAVSRGRFPSLREVRWDRNEKVNCELTVSAIFTDAGVSFAYASWPLTQSTLGDDRKSPLPNYLDPFPLPDSESDL